MLFMKTDLIDWGYEKCSPGHEYGGIRDYYLLHVVRRGKGEFQSGGRLWKLASGDAFLIFPGQSHLYRADTKEPWSYFWLGFRGEYRELFEPIRLNRDSPILSYEDPEELYRLYREMKEKRLYRPPSETLQNHGSFSMILGRLCRERPGISGGRGKTAAGKKQHIRSMEIFIHEYCDTPIQVQDVIDFVQLERSYASRIFKKERGKPIGRVLMEYRIAKACGHLKDGLSAKETAYSCGFRDYNTFLKAFKRETGKTPGSFKVDFFGR